MARRATGKPNGRPPKVIEVAKVLERTRRTGESIEGAAKAEGVAPATVHAHKAKAGKGAPAASTIKPTPSKPPGSTTSPVGNHGAALPQGGTSTPPDLLALVRRILDARNGAARAELDEGLVVAARGEQELASWLARPVTAVEVGVDELAALGRGLDLAVEVMQRAEHGGPALAALRGVVSLAKSVATVKAKRPQEPKPDEVQETIRAEMGAAVDHLLGPTREAAAKFTVDRAAFGVWCEGLGPIGVEVVRRVDAMHGGAPS